MKLGMVIRDADGVHPYARTSWVGQTFHEQVQFSSPNDAWSSKTAMFTLNLPIPPELHEYVVTAQPRLRAWVNSVPWEASQVGLLTVSVADRHAIVCLLPLAERQDLGPWGHAAAQGKLAAGLASNVYPSVTPMVRVLGFEEALEDASASPELSQADLAGAVQALRRLLRGRAARRFLGLPTQMLETLVVSVWSPDCP